MSRQIRFTFMSEGVSAVADMLEEKAPNTCNAIWDRLPVVAAAQHARYSGSEGVLLLPFQIRLAPENATSDVSPGDVAFTWFAPGSSYGVTEEITEICWFYDRDARPTMPEGPVPVNVFARFRKGSEEFYRVCRRMVWEGAKTLIVERVPEPAVEGPQDVEHCIIYRHPHGFCDQPFMARAGNGDLIVAFSQKMAQPEGNTDVDPASLPLFVRSYDEGRTWSQRPEAIGEYRICGMKLCGLNSLDDGALIALLARFNFAGASRKGTPEYEEYEAEIEGQNWIYTFAGAYQTISRNAGATWEEVQPATQLFRQQPEEPSVTHLSDGRTLKVFSRENRGIFVAVCEDAGDMWREYLLRPLPPGGKGFPVVTLLNDGSIFCVYPASDAAPLRGQPSGVCGIYGTRFRI